MQPLLRSNCMLFMQKSSWGKMRKEEMKKGPLIWMQLRWPCSRAQLREKYRDKGRGHTRGIRRGFSYKGRFVCFCCGSGQHFIQDCPHKKSLPKADWWVDGRAGKGETQEAGRGDAQHTPFSQLSHKRQEHGHQFEIHNNIRQEHECQRPDLKPDSETLVCTKG